MQSKTITKAINLKAKVCEAYQFRGIAKYNNNDKKGACLDWRRHQQSEMRQQINI